MPLSRNSPLVQNHKVIRILDSFYAMRNGNDGRLLQLLPDNLLNLKRSLVVNGSSRLIENDNCASPKDSPRESDKLPLTLAKISSSSLNMCSKVPAVPTTQTPQDFGA
jgi:hypothetical protein